MDNVKSAIGAWLVRWHGQIAPTLPAVQEFAARPVDKAVVLVPGRMIDAAQDMVNLWTRNDTDKGPSKPPKLPVVLLACARDMMPAGRDWGRDQASELDVVLSGDPQERVFKVRSQLMDQRCQLVVAAHEPDAAKSIAAQFALWAQEYGNKRSSVPWAFAGQQISWGMQLESDDFMAALVPTEAKNLTLLALDFTFKVSIPYYRAPVKPEDFDGKGHALADGRNDPQNPHGFALLQAVETQQSMAAPQGDGTDPLGARVTDADGTRPKAEV